MSRSSTSAGLVDTRIRFPRINALLGMWLCVSAFLWPHALVELVSTFAVGALTVLFAAASAYVNPNLRYVITGLALWLFISIFAFRHLSPITPWNDFFVSILMLAASLEPIRSKPRAAVQ